MAIKTIVVVLVVVLAVAFASVTQAAECPGSSLLTLTPIATNPNVTPCERDSGFSAIPPSGLPGDAQLTKMCKSSSCRALMDALKSANLGDCDLVLLGVTVNFGRLANSFYGNCARIVPRSRTVAFSRC